MTTLKNQNDNTMETTDTTSANKTITVSIPQGFKDILMPLIQRNKICYHIVGYDQSNTAILQISYGAEQEGAVKDICQVILFLEQLTALLTLTFIPFCQALSQELKAAYRQLKAEQNQKELLKQTELKSDGNQEGN